MHSSLLGLLRCPRTGQRLELESPIHDEDRVRTGWLITGDRAHRYPIREFIPRFVPESNYADNFGMQWNLFRTTQLDSYSGHPISAARFWRSTGWSPETLRGKWVLDCGCESGRFAELAVAAGANVVALDYSSAVDACFANLGHHPNLHVVQGDIYALPFAPSSFPFVYSLGVLQHTPDVAAAFAALPRMVAPGGHLCADFYEMTWKHRLLPRHFLRVFTTRMSKEQVFRTCQRWVPRLLRVARHIGRIPRIGRLLVRAIPVADYRNVLPLTEDQLREWALLDTFDWLSPEYDQPQKREVVGRWISTAGFAEASVFKAGFMIARGADKR